MQGAMDPGRRLFWGGPPFSNSKRRVFYNVQLIIEASLFYSCVASVVVDCRFCRHRQEVQTYFFCVFLRSCLVPGWYKAAWPRRSSILASLDDAGEVCCQSVTHTVWQGLIRQYGYSGGSQLFHHANVGNFTLKQTSCSICNVNINLIKFIDSVTALWSTGWLLLA